MRIEPDTLLSGETAPILQALEEKGLCHGGSAARGENLRPAAGCVPGRLLLLADLVLIEADGSRSLPLKFPREQEPVIPDNTDEILVVCGLNGLGRPAREVCHRLDLVTACLGISENIVITPAISSGW